jgi:EpsI family protein
MVAAALLAIVLTPTRLTAATAPKIDLETMIPRQFGDWHQLQELDVIAVNPAVQANLDKIYQQTLSRTYVNTKGEQIMLSLAYGGNQRDEMQVHKPEICYPAQGFQVLHMNTGALHLTQDKRDIPVKRLVTQLGERVEPVTYWITVGDQIALESLKWKLAQLKYGLTGKIPDGMLFRVSSIDANSNQAFTLQDTFINALVDGIAIKDRDRFIGHSERIEQKTLRKLEIKHVS